MFACSAWDPPDTMVSITTVEGAAKASVSLAVVGTASHCGGGHEM
jgi:hypothetical protein